MIYTSKLSKKKGDFSKKYLFAKIYKFKIFKVENFFHHLLIFPINWFNQIYFSIFTNQILLEKKLVIINYDMQNLIQQKLHKLYTENSKCWILFWNNNEQNKQNDDKKFDYMK